MIKYRDLHVLFAGRQARAPLFVWGDVGVRYACPCACPACLTCFHVATQAKAFKKAVKSMSPPQQRFATVRQRPRVPCLCVSRVFVSR